MCKLVSIVALARFVFVLPFELLFIMLINVIIGRLFSDGLPHRSQLTDAFSPFAGIDCVKLLIIAAPLSRCLPQTFLHFSTKTEVIQIPFYCSLHSAVIYEMFLASEFGVSNAF